MLTGARTWTGEASVEEVYAVIADVERYPDWHPFFERVRPTGRDPQDLARETQRLDDLWASFPANDPQLLAVLENPASISLRRFQMAFPEVAEVLATDVFGRLIAASGKSSDFNQADEAPKRPVRRSRDESDEPPKHILQPVMPSLTTDSTDPVEESSSPSSDPASSDPASSDPASSDPASSDPANSFEEVPQPTNPDKPGVEGRPGENGFVAGPMGTGIVERQTGRNRLCGGRGRDEFRFGRR